MVAASEVDAIWICGPNHARIENMRAIVEAVQGGADHQASSDTVNVAEIGVGEVGGRNIENVAESENIVALADIDHDCSSEIFDAHSEVEVYTDYRRMFDEMEHKIDAVVIAAKEPHEPPSKRST